MIAFYHMDVHKIQKNNYQPFDIGIMAQTLKNISSRLKRKTRKNNTNPDKSISNSSDDPWSLNLKASSFAGSANDFIYNNHERTSGKEERNITNPYIRT